MKDIVLTIEPEVQIIVLCFLCFIVGYFIGLFTGLGK